jgi:hypothetical protein
MKQISRWSPLWFGLVAVVILLIGVVSSTAHADGIPIPYGRDADIEMPGQKAIIVYDEEAGREDLILSVQLLGESSEAAWVVPVPSLPEVNAASAEWFSYLSDLTQPKIATRYVPFPMMGGASEIATQKGVELLSREQVGVYDVSILSSDEPGALVEWLNDHGYSFPEEGEPILDAYVQEGWYFMATRVVPGETAYVEGDVHPIRLSFDTDEPVYPMRLTALVNSYMDVLIYVLADHRMEIKGEDFKTEFAGPLTLSPVASEEGDLANLLTSKTYYVTKLRSWSYASWEATDDLYLQQAATDESYRMVVYQTSINPCLACCPGLAPLGLVVGLGLAGLRRSRS